jgi:hypothetical protein
MTENHHGTEPSENAASLSASANGELSGETENGLEVLSVTNDV